MATKKTVPPAKKAAKKAAAKKGAAPASLNQDRFPAALHAAAKEAADRKKDTGRFLPVAANAAPCLPATTATGIVFSCAGGPIALNQTLGQIFPNDNARSAFCNCVTTAATAAGHANPVVPCGKTKTVGEVIQSISC